MFLCYFETLASEFPKKVNEATNKMELKVSRNIVKFHNLKIVYFLYCHHLTESLAKQRNRVDSVPQDNSAFFPLIEKLIDMATCDYITSILYR